MLPNRFVTSVLTPLEGIRYLSMMPVYEVSQTLLRMSAFKTAPRGKVVLVSMFTPDLVF